MLLESFVITNAKSVIRTARPDIKNVGKEIQEMIIESKNNPDSILFLHRENNPDMYFYKGERILFYKDKLKMIDGELVSAEPLTTLWADILSNNLHNEGGVSLEHLIKRVMELATDEGDLILDSFLGSGTTAAVAHKMKRKYIGIEMGEQAFTHCKPRLDSVISNDDKSGITKAVNWQGGGGYRFYELAPTLINKDEFGEYIINPDYSADMLAAAMALHEGFTYEPDSSAFWKQSHGNEKSYLFVTTRHLNAAFMDSIIGGMEDDEYLVIACCSFDSINNISAIDDAELYSLLLTEYSGWLGLCKSNGIPVEEPKESPVQAVKSVVQSCMSGCIIKDEETPDMLRFHIYYPDNRKFGILKIEKKTGALQLRLLSGGTPQNIDLASAIDLKKYM